MWQQNNQMSEHQLEKNIRSIVHQVSKEKLLPKILWNAAKEFGSKKLINYQKSVRKQYEQELKTPLKYDPQEAKSDREKFREKVLKLMSNELQVEYVQNLRLKDRTLITYNGKELEECKIPTKKEFQMFSNFNEKRFKETYSNIFEDKLELDYPHLYQNKAKERCHTLHVLQNKDSTAIQELRSHEPILKTQLKETQNSMRKTQRKRDLSVVQSARKKQLIYFNEKKTVGALIPHDEQSAILKIMKEIGRFDIKMQATQLCITKQSIFKWLKLHYEKPNRIFDFLELPQVLTLQEFQNISRKLRVMPLQHIFFMTFLYYDGNNDGYICDYDLERVSHLAAARNVLTHDFQKIKQSAIKKILTKREPYLDLYKLSEVTETKYFEWKQRPIQTEPMNGLELEMKNRVLSSKQKHIFVDFEAFFQIYRNDKPFLWYDLMFLFSGSAYQGLKYQ